MDTAVEVTRRTTTAALRTVWPVGRLRKALLAGHVVTSSALIGADAVVLTLGVVGLRGDPVTVYPAMHLVAAYLMAPLAVIALASGLVLATRSRWGLVGYWWVALKLVITILGTTAILFALVKATGHAADLALARSAAESINRIAFVLVATVTTSLLVVNAVLGVTKPGWRFRRRG